MPQSLHLLPLTGRAVRLMVGNTPVPARVLELSGLSLKLAVTQSIAPVPRIRVELEDADGSRTFVPGLMLHTETTTHGPAGVRSSSVQFNWRPPAAANAHDPEELRGLVKHLALLSPRRALGTPVLVRQLPDSNELCITLTPYDRSERDALRLEITRRLTDAYAAAPSAAPQGEDLH